MTMIDRLSEHQRRVVIEAQRALPVRLGDIARAFNVSVKASTLPAGISGEIRPSGQSYEIKVNRHDSRGRQRFTVAHELAHYFLHRDQIGNGVSDDALYRSTLSDAREAEANRLAAEVLMPKEKVLEAAREYVGLHEDRAAKLADIFEVSEIAMEIRLSQLE